MTTKAVFFDDPYRYLTWLFQHLPLPTTMPRRCLGTSPLCLPKSIPTRLDSGWYRLQNVAAKDQYARSLH
jgi:hypothetical protein